MGLVDHLFTAPGRSEREARSTAAQLSLDSVLALLKSSRSPSEARYAGLLLREYVGIQATSDQRLEQSVADPPAPAQAAEEALRLLRSARSPFEAHLAGEALLMTLSPQSSSPVEERSQGGEVHANSYNVLPRTEVLNKISVLVVEDDPHYRQLLLTTLVRSGAQVAGTGTVEEAIKLIAQKAPDVVVSDIELPRGSGYDLMERIDPRIPVLAISSHPQDMSTLRDAGFRFFFSKEPGVLRDIVNTIARMPAVIGTPQRPIVPIRRNKPSDRR